MRRRSGRANFPHPALGQRFMLSPTEGRASVSPIGLTLTFPTN